MAIFFKDKRGRIRKINESDLEMFKQMDRASQVDRAKRDKLFKEEQEIDFRKDKLEVQAKVK